MRRPRSYWESSFLRSTLPVVALAVAACGGSPPPPPELSALESGDTTALVERGEYLVRNVAVCGHCHADDVKDPDGPLSGGYEFTGWRIGTIRASNLTPDSATGLGRWSPEEIVRAVRTGADRDGDVLAPVMPYGWFHGMSDRDAAAVARYLGSLAPVRNPVENDENLIFDVAEALFLGPEDPPHGTAPRRSETAAYGQYLAVHVGLCADCHTPREGIMNTPDTDRLFIGQNDPPDGFPARPDNLTPDPETGIGRWTEEDFLRTLRTGVNPEGDTLDPFMAWRQYRRMDASDLRAIFRYLQTLEPVRNEVRETPPGSRPPAV